MVRMLETPHLENAPIGAIFIGGELYKQTAKNKAPCGALVSSWY